MGKWRGVFSIATILATSLATLWWSSQSFAFFNGLPRPLTHQNPLSLEQPSNPEPFLSSTVRLGLCSGTIVSRWGHVLTALHCLNQQDLTTSSESFQLIGWGQATIEIPQIPALLMVAPKSRYRVTFGATLDSNRATFPLEAEVLATGDAYAMSFPLLEDPSVRQSPEQVRLGHELLHDFALVRVPSLSVPGLSNSKCARVASAVEQTELHWTLGYPAYVGSEDKNLDVSGLPVIHPARPRADLRGAFESVLPADPYETFEARVRVGLSGGGVFNSSGELVAINAFQDRGNQEIEKGFSKKLVAYRVSNALHRIRQALSPTEFQQAFDCPSSESP